MSLSVPDADLLDRWLAMLGLVAAAEDFAARRTGAWAGLAVVAADAAIEAALGLIATGGSKPPEGQERFSDLLALSELAFKDAGDPIDVRLRDRILRTHRSRNSALHVGLDPSERTVQTAIAAARDVLGLASRASPVLGRIAGVGPVRAVAELVDVPVIKDALNLASEALARADPIGAADQAAIALETALSRLDPPLRDRMGRLLPRGSIPRVSTYGPQSAIGIDEITRPLEKHADLIEAWLLALAIGVRPGELARLRRQLGYVTVTLVGQVSVQRAAEIDLTLATAEASLLQVTSIVFRLVVNGELRVREPWEKPTIARTEHPGPASGGDDPSVG
jgi:hypothetical protein